MRFRKLESFLIEGACHPWLACTDTGVSGHGQGGHLLSRILPVSRVNQRRLKDGERFGHSILGGPETAQPDQTFRVALSIMRSLEECARVVISLLGLTHAAQ